MKKQNDWMQNNWKRLIHGLLYTIMFERNPLDAVERTIMGTIDGHALGASPQEYLNAMGIALESNESLAELLPQDHSEQVIRSFLTEVKRRLEIEIRENRIDANAKWKDDVDRFLLPLESSVAHISETPEDIDAIIDKVVIPVIQYHTPYQFAESLRIGLASDIKLSEFISKYYPEESIRSYLRKIQQRLDERFGDVA